MECFPWQAIGPSFDMMHWKTDGGSQTQIRTYSMQTIWLGLILVPWAGGTHPATA